MHDLAVLVGENVSLSQIGRQGPRMLFARHLRHASSRFADDLDLGLNGAPSISRPGSRRTTARSRTTQPPARRSACRRDATVIPVRDIHHLERLQNSALRIGFRSPSRSIKSTSRPTSSDNSSRIAIRSHRLHGASSRTTPARRDRCPSGSPRAKPNPRSTVR